MKKKCPVCGAAELIHDTRDLPYTYKGETTTIRRVTGEFCPACEESILDGAESDRVMREMQTFSKQVNADLVDAFSRYENGKTKPPLALVKLLKVLDRHPELLKEVKVA
jgi:HTH-type transcriptional regulator/antitoxin MqsA